MPRSGNTFTWGSIGTWSGPISGDSLDVTGWNTLRDDIAASLSQSLRNDGVGTMSGPLQAHAGTEGAPSLTFAVDPTTGIYQSATGVIGFSTAGTMRATLNSSQLRTTVPIRTVAGSPLAPSFSFDGDPDTGVYSEGSNVINFATEGVERLSITGAEVMLQQPIQVPDGTVSLPSLTFKEDTNCGFYRSNNDEVAFTAAGARSVEFSSTGIRLYRVASNWVGLEFWNAAGNRRALLDLDSEAGNVALYPVYGTASGSYGTAGRPGGYIWAWDQSNDALLFGCPLRIPDGSASAPSLCFGNEYNTGFRRGGTGQLDVVLAGTNRFEFSATGLSGEGPAVSANNTQFATTAAVVSYVSPLRHITGLQKASHTSTATTATQITSWDTGTNFTKDTTSFGANASSGYVVNSNLDAHTFVAEFTLSGYIYAAAGNNTTTIEIRKDGVALTHPPILREFLTDGTANIEFSVHGVVDLAYAEQLSVWVHANNSSSRVYKNLLFTVKRVT